MKQVKYISVAFEDGSRHRIDPAGLCAACVAWLGMTREGPKRRRGRPTGGRQGMTAESAKQTALMVSMRLEEKLTLAEIGDIFGVTKEAVRLRLKRADAATQAELSTCWKKEPRVVPITPGGFAKRVRAWVRESGEVYCARGKHVVAPGEMCGPRACRKCNAKRHRDWAHRKTPGVVRRTAEQVARMRSARWG